ncbi:hypothetical protein B566_EDAN016188 [Ephemera danica]|nr:hypothetical protein B566_EDAN016188 [Ephemera danica]
MPKFSGKDEIMPKEFILKLDEYFELHNIHDDYQLRIAFRCLQDGAKITYTEFKEAIMKTYWNESKRREYKKSLFSERYDSRSTNLSMVEFLTAKYVRATYLEPPLGEHEIIEGLRGLYPFHIKNVLIAAKADTYATASELLQTLEASNNFVQQNQQSTPQLSH